MSVTHPCALHLGQLEGTGNVTVAFSVETPATHIGIDA